MTPYLRSVAAQCCNRGARSIRSRQAARDFSSLHESTGNSVAWGLIFRGISFAIGYGLASVFVGNPIPMIEERERQDLKFLEQSAQQRSDKTVPPRKS